MRVAGTAIATAMKAYAAEDARKGRAVCAREKDWLNGGDKKGNVLEKGGREVVFRHEE